MVSGIGNTPNPGISSVSKPKGPQETNSPAAESKNSASAVSVGTSEVSGAENIVERREVDAVVIDISEESISSSSANNVEAEVAEVNRAASGSEAPTTQELSEALNKDTVAAALGNTVNIEV